MSDTTNSTDAVLDHLRDRRAALSAEIMHLQARRDEVQELMDTISDGRSKLRRKARTAGNSSTADGQGPLPDPMRSEDAP